MTEPDWQSFDASLEAAATRGPVRFWLRDDDAVDVTPALARLADLCGECGMPVLLAVIPQGMTPALPTWLSSRRSIIPCQHGFNHTNHARAGDRACELGGERSDATVLDELRDGRSQLQHQFAPTGLSDILVPPWNRIRDSLVPQLAPLGFAALSTFAGDRPHPAAALPRLDCDLDIIDWRNGRRGRSEADLCARLTRLVTTLDRPIGMLTHHLAHDEAAWSFLRRFLAVLRDDARVRFCSAPEILGSPVP